MVVVGDMQQLEQAVAGDMVALERLLLHHYDLVRQHADRQLPSWLGRSVGVDDVVQMTFSEAFRSIGNFTPQSMVAFQGWLKTLADHRIQDMIRYETRQKRGGQRQPVAMPAVDDSVLVDDFLQQIAASGPSPSRVVSHAEAVQAVRLALAQLPDDYRQVVELHYLRGQTLDECAETMERSRGAVRGLLDRAKRDLKEILDRASRYLSS